MRDTLTREQGVSEMPTKIYKVDLTANERAELQELTRQGKVSARRNRDWYR